MLAHGASFSRKVWKKRETNEEAKGEGASDGKRRERLVPESYHPVSARRASQEAHGQVPLPLLLQHPHDDGAPGQNWAVAPMLGVVCATPRPQLQDTRESRALGLQH